MEQKQKSCLDIATECTIIGIEIGFADGYKKAMNDFDIKAPIPDFEFGTPPRNTGRKPRQR